MRINSFGLLLAIVEGFLICYTIYTSDKNEKWSPDGKKPLYTPYVSSLTFILVISITPILSVALFDIKAAVQKIIGFNFSIFLQVFLYYLVLIPCIPILRKFINARACAVLWLIPSCMHIMQYEPFAPDKPIFILAAPYFLVIILFLVWFIGFLTVMVWKIGSHIKFRRYILKNSSEITDRNIIDIWYDELERSRIHKTDYPLLKSNLVKTPVSIGIFKSKIFVVIPEKSYSDDDLKLIFRHEIVHIGRADSLAKFYNVFCTAICWFNPLMWFAMRKSADDIELSCDETVLLDADEKIRARYANLILETAGDERGFTTCLSASANALRYRLKHIVKPNKKFSGAVIVFLIFIVMCMTTGYTALVYGDYTGKDIIFSASNTEDFKLSYVGFKPDNEDYICTNENALKEYLLNLRIQNISGVYNFKNEKKRWVTISYETPNDYVIIKLFGNFIKVQPRQNISDFDYYYLPDGIDFDKLHELIKVDDFKNIKNGMYIP